MQNLNVQFPFSKVSLTQQPFGLRVQCVLDAGLIKESSYVTGLAIEATGGMEPYFGLSAFSKGVIKDFGRSLGGFLGKVDKQNGTIALYWGTNDVTSYQSLGFRSASEWDFFQFGRPALGFGRRGNLLSVLRYFLDDEHLSARQTTRQSEGIFIFLLDGALDDYPGVLDFLSQFASDVANDRKKRSNVILVGFGENFIEASQGQLHALAALSNRTSPPIISSLTVQNTQNLIENVKDAVMVYIKTSRSGAIFNGSNQLIQDYPTGVPGAFQFYLPPGSKSFMLNLDGVLYTQTV